MKNIINITEARKLSISNNQLVVEKDEATHKVSLHEIDSIIVEVFGV